MTSRQLRIFQMNRNRFWLRKDIKIADTYEGGWKCHLGKFDRPRQEHGRREITKNQLQLP